MHTRSVHIIWTCGHGRNIYIIFHTCAHMTLPEIGLVHWGVSGFDIDPTWHVVRGKPYFLHLLGFVYFCAKKKNEEKLWIRNQVMFKKKKRKKERYNLLQLADLSQLTIYPMCFSLVLLISCTVTGGLGLEGAGGLWRLWKRWSPDRRCQRVNQHGCSFFLFFFFMTGQHSIRTQSRKYDQSIEWQGN